MNWKKLGKKLLCAVFRLADRDKKAFKLVGEEGEEVWHILFSG